MRLPTLSAVVRMLRRLNANLASATAIAGRGHQRGFTQKSHCRRYLACSMLFADCALSLPENLWDAGRQRQHAILEFGNIEGQIKRRRCATGAKLPPITGKPC